MKQDQLKTRQTLIISGRLALTVLWLVLAYGFAVLAISSGRWWQWLIAFVSLIYGFSSLIKLIGKLVKHGSRKSAERLN